MLLVLWFVTFQSIHPSSLTNHLTQCRERFTAHFGGQWHGRRNRKPRCCRADVLLRLSNSHTGYFRCWALCYITCCTSQPLALDEKPMKQQPPQPLLASGRGKTLKSIQDDCLQGDAQIKMQYKPSMRRRVSHGLVTTSGSLKHCEKCDPSCQQSPDSLTAVIHVG